MPTKCRAAVFAHHESSPICTWKQSKSVDISACGHFGLLLYVYWSPAPERERERGAGCPRRAPRPETHCRPPWAGRGGDRHARQRQPLTQLLAPDERCVDRTCRPCLLVGCRKLCS